jgi:hypothetical protein
MTLSLMLDREVAIKLCLLKGENDTFVEASIVEKMQQECLQLFSSKHVQFEHLSIGIMVMERLQKFWSVPLLRNTTECVCDLLKQLDILHKLNYIHTIHICGVCIFTSVYFRCDIYIDVYSLGIAAAMLFLSMSVSLMMSIWKVKTITKW